MVGCLLRGLRRSVDRFSVVIGLSDRLSDDRGGCVSRRSRSGPCGVHMMSMCSSVTAPSTMR